MEEYKIFDVYYVNDYTNEDDKIEYGLNSNDPKLHLLYILFQIDSQSNNDEIRIILKNLLNFLKTSIKNEIQFKNMDKLHYVETIKNDKVYKTHGTILNFLTNFIYINHEVIEDHFRTYIRILFYFLYLGSRYVFDGETFLPIMIFFRIVNLPHIETMKLYDAFFRLIERTEIKKLPNFEKTVKDILNATYDHDYYPTYIRTQRIYLLQLTKGYTLLQFLIQNNFEDQVKKLFKNEYIDLNKNNPFFTALIYFDETTSKNETTGTNSYPGKEFYLSIKYIELFFKTPKSFDINQYGTEGDSDKMTSFMKLIELHDKYLFDYLKSMMSYFMTKNINWDLRLKVEENTPILLFYLTNRNSIVSQYLNSEEKFNFFKNKDNNHSKFYNSVLMYKRLFDKGGKKLFKQKDENGFSVLVFLLHLNLEFTGNKEIDELIQCFHDSINKNKEIVKNHVLELIKKNKLIEGKTINGTKINVYRILYQSIKFEILDSDEYSYYLFDLLYNINNDDAFQILKIIIANIDVETIYNPSDGTTFRSVLYKLLKESETEKNRLLNDINIGCLEANKRYFNLYSRKLHELWNIITNNDEYNKFLDNIHDQQKQIKNVLSKYFKNVDEFINMNDLINIDINQIQPEYFYTYVLPLPYDIIDGWKSCKEVSWIKNMNKKDKEKIYNDLKNLVKKPESEYVIDTAAFEELF